MTSDNIVETSELIGAGTYRKLFKVSYYGANCVAKELFGTSETSDAKAGTAENDIIDQFVNKGQLLAQLCHPNIVQFFGIHFKPDPTSRKMRPIMVMEKMESSLSAFLENHSNIPTAVKLSILLDVSSGLRYLHGQKPAVVHCNLTSNNILLTSQLQAKIGDVGVIQMMGYEKQSQKKNVQCEAFMAPEVRTNLLKMSFAELVCHPSMDIFSYGAVILHTITQQWPAQPLADDNESLTSQTEVERHQSQLNQTAMSSKRLISLITACLDNDPNKRPTTIQVSEIVKKMSEKLPVVTKSPIVWQAEVEEAHKQGSEMEKKLANEVKAKEQVQIKYENLQKLIQVNFSEFDHKSSVYKELNKRSDGPKQTQDEPLEKEISRSKKKSKANSLQYHFNSSSVPMSFQLVLKKDDCQYPTNSAIECVKFQSDLKDLPEATIQCPHHPFLELSKFCLDCEVELCYNCAKNHSTHNVTFFFYLTMNHDSLERKIQQQLNNMKKNKIKLDQKKIEIQKRAKESSEEIRMGFAKLHKIVNMQEEKTLQKLSLQTEDFGKEYDLYLNVYSLRAAQLKLFLNTIEHAKLVSKRELYKVSKSLLQHGNNLLLIGKDLKVPIHEKLLEISAEQFESICTEIGTLGISPDARMCSITTIPDVVYTDRKTTLVVTVKDQEGFAIANYKNKLTVEIKSTYSLGSKSMLMDMRELGGGQYEVSYTLKYSGEYNLKIMVCGVDIPGTPCKITCKFSSDWTLSTTVAVTPPPVPDAAISDTHQFKIKALNQTYAMIEIGARCKGGVSRQYKLKGLSSGDDLKVSVSGRIGILHEKFQALYEEISSPKSLSPIDPQNILQLIASKYPRFGKCTQEDSHEVLRCLLTEMKNEEVENIKEKARQHFGVGKDQSLASLDGESKLMLKNYLRAASSIGKTPIEKAVGGVRINTVICRKCHIPMQSEEQFFDISLPVPDDEASSVHSSAYGRHNINTQQSYNTSQQYHHEEASGFAKQVDSTALDADGVQSLLIAEDKFYQPITGIQHVHDLTGLEKSLAAHTSVDNMDKDNKFFCTECNKNSSSEILTFVCKQLLIHKLPQVLILHLKRFTIGAYTVTKNKARVTFPPVLDMAPYSSNLCLQKFGDGANRILYGLYAVVEHMGTTLHAGHYIAYVKRRPKRDKPKSPKATDVKWLYDEAAAHEGIWFRTSDLTIKECKEGFKEVERSEAYLLFYELLPSRPLV